MIIALVPLFVAGIIFYIAALALATWWQRRADIWLLLLAVLSILVMGYNLSCTGLYLVSGIRYALPWQIAQSVLLSFAAAALVWYLALVLGNTKPLVPWILSLLHLFYLLSLVLAPAKMHWSAYEASIKYFALPFVGPIFLHEVSGGPLQTFQIFVNAASVLWGAIMAGAAIRKKIPGAKAFLVSTLIILVASINDSLVSQGIWHAPYLLEYSFAGMIFLLSAEFIRRYIRYEVLLKSLTQSEQRFSKLVQSSPLGIQTLEIKEGTLVLTGYNHAACSILGIDHSPFLGRPLAEAIPHLARTKMIDELTTALVAGHSWAKEFITFREGDLHYAMSVTAYPTAPGTAAVIIEDIRERKRNERILRANQESLNSMQMLLSGIIDSLPIILIAVNASGKVSHWNRTAAQTLGITSNEAVGQTLDLVSPLLVRYAPAVTRVILSSHPERYSSEAFAVDEHFTTADVGVYPLPASSGALVFVENTTAQLEMAALLARHERIRSVGNLAAGIAHEINNPLAGIITGSEVIKRRLELEREQDQALLAELGLDQQAVRSWLGRRGVLGLLDDMRLGAIRAANIVRALLDFSRSNARTRQMVDVARLLEETIVLATNEFDLQNHYDFRKVNLVRVFPEQAILLPIDPGALQQAVLNLLKNGAHAMFDAGVADPRMELILRTDSESVELCIRDNGPGLSPAMRSALFEPFLTTKAPGKGTGLGLFVSAYLVTEKLGGSITLDPPGESPGTCFRIRLPRAVDNKEGTP